MVFEIVLTDLITWLVTLTFCSFFVCLNLIVSRSVACCLDELASRYPAMKFVKIISTDCIPNYPDCNLPTLLAYRHGAVEGTHVGLKSVGRRCTPESKFETFFAFSLRRMVSEHVCFFSYRCSVSFVSVRASS